MKIKLHITTNSGVGIEAETEFESDFDFDRKFRRLAEDLIVMFEQLELRDKEDPCAD